jgi:flagellar biosynthetic protein FliR
MQLFQFTPEEMLTFFAVLVRFSVLIAILPFFGNHSIPTMVKVLLAFIISVALFPTLTKSGAVRIVDTYTWGKNASTLIGTICLEAVFGLAFGFVAKLVFDAIHLGANLSGTFMGFAAANIYDPHQEAHTQVVAEVQTALAMLIFLVLEGHHYMLKAALNSYSIVGMGKAGFSTVFSQSLIEFTSKVLVFGVQLSAPVCFAIFGVNIVFGIMAKAMTQINILVLSFGVTVLVGLGVIYLGVPEFQLAAGNVLGRMEDWLEIAKIAIAKDGS